jgi:hypothetical protein
LAIACNAGETDNVGASCVLVDFGHQFGNILRAAFNARHKPGNGPGFASQYTAQGIFIAIHIRKVPTSSGAPH